MSATAIRDHEREHERDQDRDRDRALRKEPGREPRTVLLVEGSRSARQAMLALLDRGDHPGWQAVSASEAEDGVEALCSLGSVKPDAILMSVRAARLDGFQTCALIKNSDLFRHVRVVLMSDEDCLLTRTRAELAGADAFLVRPFRHVELARALCGTA